MRVFVAGATGVVGRRLVPMLAGRGHQVVGMTRSDSRASLLRDLGAQSAVCDAYDADGLRAVVAAARPEVVVHQLTDLPPNLDPRKAEQQYAGNDRIREEGTRNLVAAATAAGARRVVAQSIAFAYRADGEALKEEDEPLYEDAPAPFDRSVRALQVLEGTVTGTPGIEGVVLRYGFFYGPGSSYAADGHTAREVRRRRMPLLGGGTGVFSFIHVDDAAAAAVVAIEGGPPGIFNVVDDEPAAMAEWLPFYADLLEAKRPRRLPLWLGRLVAGRFTAMMATELRGASNRRMKAAFGWEPRYPTWRTGLRDAMG